MEPRQLPAMAAGLLLTCTLSPLTILQLLGLGNIFLIAFMCLDGTAHDQQTRKVCRKWVCLAAHRRSPQCSHGVLLLP